MLPITVFTGVIRTGIKVAMNNSALKLTIEKDGLTERINHPAVKKVSPDYFPAIPFEVRISKIECGRLRKR